MKRVAEFVEYFTAILNAISKGIKVCSDHWPNSSPFSNRSIDNSNGTKE